MGRLRPRVRDRPAECITKSGHYFHPFHEHEGLSDSDHEHPRTVIELRMSNFSSHIRDEPEWWLKMKDAKSTAKWQAEAHEQQKDLPEERKLTENMIDYVFAELEAYASLRDEFTGIQPGPYERIWKSDSLIPTTLWEALSEAAAPLEETSKEQRDGQQLLNLVDPALYSVVYGRTQSQRDYIIPPENKSYFFSQIFQILPSEFQVASDGVVTLASPYINNIHHTSELYGVLPSILQHAIPMFERVLSDLRRHLLDWRVPTSQCIDPDPQTVYSRVIAASCIWPNGMPDPEGEEEEDEWDTNPDGWFRKKPMQLPDVKGNYGGDLDVIKQTVSLKENTVQCIFKLANIVLSPNEPSYRGSKWHVEGMKNERIVASFIYYYDNENITESRIAFRRATGNAAGHGQDDHFCIKILYNFTSGDPCVQDLGSTAISSGKCIAFPNTYQHQITPFELKDPSKPGHCKFLMIHFIDPTVRIPSTTDVAPQQRELIQEVMREPRSLFRRLPVEINEMITNLVEGLMTRAEAEGYRNQLLKEREFFVDQNTSKYFGQEFGIWDRFN